MTTMDLSVAANRATREVRTSSTTTGPSHTGALTFPFRDTQHHRHHGVAANLRHLVDSQFGGCRDTGATRSPVTAG